MKGPTRAVLLPAALPRQGPGTGKRRQRQALRAAEAAEEARRGRELLAWFEADADWAFSSPAGINFVYEA